MHISQGPMVEIPLEAICNTHFLRFLCHQSSFVSFRRDAWNKKRKNSRVEQLYKSMEAHLVEEYDDNCYLSSEFGNACNIKLFSMSSIFEDYLLLNENLMQWTYPMHPEDPAFYREDKSCLLHIVVHEELCFYYPRDEKEVLQLKTCGIFNQQEWDDVNSILNFKRK